MKIRPITRGDVEGFVDRLWIPFQREMAPLEPYHPLADDIRESGLAHRRDRLDDDRTETFLAIADDGLAGVASVECEEQPPLFERDPDLHVSELFVRKPHRRAGVATALLDGCVARGEGWDCETVSLSVNVGNDAARTLYEREGFEVDRHRLIRELAWAE